MYTYLVIKVSEEHLSVSVISYCSTLREAEIELDRIKNNLPENCEIIDDGDDYIDVDNGDFIESYQILTLKKDKICKKV